MNIAYARISTYSQHIDTQKHEIQLYCDKNSIHIDKWIEEIESGMQNKRVHEIFDFAKPGDILLVSELSRIGRKYWEIIEFLKKCLDYKIKVISIKENIEIADDVNSMVYSFAFSLNAQLERNLISQRTKEGLARTRAKGTILGRPKGSNTKINILNDNLTKVLKMKEEGKAHRVIAKKFNVSKSTVDRFFQIRKNK